MNFKTIIIGALLCWSSLSVAQYIPAPAQEKSILILNATAHLGNGEVIENAAVGFKAGKITLVSTTSQAQNELSSYETHWDAKGQHLYPGFIMPNATLGLVEIDAVKSSDDEEEIGNFNPNVRSLIAYTADSKVIETVRPNGILMAQITPRGGRVAGTSSIVQLDAWHWQDAVIKENDGVHISLPQTFKRSGWWAEPGGIEPNKEYQKELEELRAYFQNAKTYMAGSSPTRNLIAEATKGLFEGTQTLFIHANEEKQITDGIQLALDYGIQKIVVVGGFEAYKVAPLLQQHKIGVFLRRVHDMPINEDQDVNLPYKMAKILTDLGIVVGLENSGSKERMSSRNLPFLAGTCVAYGLDKEKALQLITLNTAKLLGIEAQCGSIAVGKDATLFLSEGDALDMRTNQLTVAFIQGRKINLETHQTRLSDKYKYKYQQN